MCPIDDDIFSQIDISNKGLSLELHIFEIYVNIMFTHFELTYIPETASNICSSGVLGRCKYFNQVVKVNCY